MSNILRGSRIHNSKLTEDLVKEIRRRLATGEPRVALAREFRVSRTAINNIAWGLTWKHVQQSLSSQAPGALGQKR